MYTWYVSYQFKNGGLWTTNFFYVDAISLEKAEEAARKVLNAITVKWKILEVRRVGE